MVTTLVAVEGRSPGCSCMWVHVGGQLQRLPLDICVLHGDPSVVVAVLLLAPPTGVWARAIAAGPDAAVLMRLYANSMVELADPATEAGKVWAGLGCTWAHVDWDRVVQHVRGCPE